MSEVFQNIDSLQGLSLVLNGVFLGAIVYLYKEKNSNQKGFEDRLDKKDVKIDKLIEDTTNDFKRIIEDGFKDKIDTKVLMDKTYDLLSEMKRIMHKING